MSVHCVDPRVSLCFFTFGLRRSGVRPAGGHDAVWTIHEGGEERGQLAGSAVNGTGTKEVRPEPLTLAVTAVSPTYNTTYKHTVTGQRHECDQHTHTHTTDGTHTLHTTDCFLDDRMKDMLAGLTDVLGRADGVVLVVSPTT